MVSAQKKKRSELIAYLSFGVFIGLIPISIIISIFFIAFFNAIRDFNRKQAKRYKINDYF